MFEKEVRRVKADIEQDAIKRETLRNLDCFILDNSIRESTVGQLRGHTLENKWKIYEEVRKCGFNNIVVAAFAHMTRVDDHFVQQLVESGEDRSTLFAFTEATAGVKNGVMDTKTLPTYTLSVFSIRFLVNKLVMCQEHVMLDIVGASLRKQM